MTYNEARVYLDEMSKYGSVLGLDAIRNLLAELGNPQEDLHFIHIAGTNGKGSVLAYLSAVLSEAGYRTGGYVSPAVVSELESIQADGKWISEEEFAALTEEVKAAAERLAAKGKGNPTVFELETAVAFLYFRKKHCDLAVVETGLGGLLDATNVIEHTEAAVITSISMDHMGVLGNTLEEIAGQKAGILKKGCAVVSAPQKPEVTKVLADRAEKLGCSFTQVDPDAIQRIGMDVTGQSFSYREKMNLEIALPGTFQTENAALACEAAEALRKRGYHISDQALRTGLKKTRWPGRFSCISKNPMVILDGAHNENAALRLRETLEQCLPGKRIVAVMGVFKDKEYEKIAESVLPLTEKVFTVDLPNRERTLPAEELAATAAKYCACAEPAENVETALEKALAEAGEDGVVLVFGSLSYLGKVMKIMENKKQNSGMDPEKIRQAARLFLEGIGEDPEREGLLETPDRVARMCEELYGGLQQDAEEHLSKVFRAQNNEMVVERDITFYSTCEHHLLPFYGKAHIAYVPDGKVAGLSKLARTVEVYARRPQIQEQMTAQIADALMERLQPKGVMVVLEAEHMCMTMRGIKKPGSQTVTVVKRGVFQEEERLSAAFWEIAGGRKA